MTAFTPTACSRAAGVNNAAALTAVTAADTFPAGGNVYFRVKNTGASPVTVTVNPAAGGGPQGTTVAPLALAPAVPATTGDVTYGPFPQNPFGDQNGNVNVTYSSTTSVTAGSFIYPSV
jgi:hypothetical protein